MSYGPRTGSTAAKAIAHMRLVNTPLTSSVLADAIGSDATTTAMCLGAAVKAGLVAVAKVGRNNFFSIGAGQPASQVHDDDDDEPIRRKATDQPLPASSGRSIFDHASAVPHPTSWSAPAKAPATAARAKPTREKAEPRSFVVAPRTTAAPIASAPDSRTAMPPHSGLACAIFNTGDLLLETDDGEALRLNRDQTRALVAYLERVAHSMETS